MVSTKKKIVICCDGTGNDSDGTINSPTNIAKIARCLDHGGPAIGSKPSDPPIPQVVYYQSGIGTKSSGILGEKFDGLTGRGITENIRSAYSFICNNYQLDDEIYLLGFSRGAYTARCISTLLNDVGILTKHSLGYFYDIFHAWQAKNLLQKTNGHGSPPKWDDIFKALNQEKNPKEPVMAYPGKDVRVAVCAVFDTVGSLGISASDEHHALDYIKDILRGVGWTHLPGLGKGTEAFEFVDTVVSPNIDNAFQALALDEHRGHFPPTVWENPDKNSKTHLEQCWFAGCHSHIGGGISDNTELPSISLAWMLDKLSPFLGFKVERINCTSRDDNLLGALGMTLDEERNKGNVLADSYTSFYKYLDTSVPRTPGQYRTHRKNKDGKVIDGPLINSNETIHHTVRGYWGNKKMLPDHKPYIPLGLKDHWHKPEVEPWTWTHVHHAEKVPDLPQAPIGAKEKEIRDVWNDGSAGHPGVTQ